MAVANLRIEPNESAEYPMIKEIYLNDFPIGKYIKNLDIHIGNHEIVSATIEFMVKPDIPENLIAEITANISEPIHEDVPTSVESPIKGTPIDTDELINSIKQKLGSLT